MMTRYCTQPIPEHGNMGVCGLRVDATGRCPDADAPTHQVKPTAQTHDYQAAPVSDDGTCWLPVKRPDSSTQLCGEPIKSPVHDPAAYLAYAEELRVELRKWSAPRVSLEDLVAEYGQTRQNLGRAFGALTMLELMDASTEKHARIAERLAYIRRLCAGIPAGVPAQILRILDGGE